MDLEGGLGHLTYSTLVHPGDTWDEMHKSVRSFVPRVKARQSPSSPFAMSLRLSAASAAALTSKPEMVTQFSEWLEDEDLYVITVNAFPYGPFKGGPVKERVYKPDWATVDRRNYTIQVAELLAVLAPEGVAPSIQSAPLAFAPNVVDAAYVETFTQNVLLTVAALVEIERRTGITVRLALEPEPHCFLATTPETVAYFEAHLYSGTGAKKLAGMADLSLAEVHGALRRHLGVVFDICHQAVEFEDIADSLAQLESAGIPVFKLQEAAALWIPEVNDEAVRELERFADTIYLTQTTQLRDGQLRRFLNVEDAIAAWQDQPGPCEWRTHFHVPVFLDDLGPFRTTQFAIRDALAVHRQVPVSDHLEIETYTFDVLPAHLKSGDIVDYVDRELDWVRAELGHSKPQR